MERRLTQNGLLISLCILFLASRAVAQVGFGTQQPSKSAIIEIKSDSRGLLIPRIALTDLQLFSPIVGVSPTDSAHANALLVYNVTTAPTENLSPGFYFWQTTGSPGSGQWHRLIMDTDAFGTEPWFVQNTSHKAVLNTSPIYQMASVAIGKDDAISGAMLDVAGSIRAGVTYATNPVIGVNAIAVGEKVRATGKNTAAFGYKSEATAEGAFAGGGYAGKPGGNAIGKSAFAFGHSVTASGDYAVAFGDQTTASKSYAVAMGKETRATHYYAFAMGSSTLAAGNSAVALGKETVAEGNYSFAMGRGTRAEALGETVFGYYNLLLPGNQISWNATDPLFVIGNGTDATNRSNAVTVLKNGWVGLGFTAPTGDDANERLAVDGTITTTSTTYPDYVFQHYFDSASKINPGYRFKPLDEVAQFIQTHHHLPGIQPASALPRTSTGDYIINMNTLVLNALEKIEELYLYTIQQKRRIDQLQDKLAKLSCALHQK